MAYFTCSRCGTVTSRELHWHGGEWCSGPTQVGSYVVIASANAPGGCSHGGPGIHGDATCPDTWYSAHPTFDAPTVGPFVIGKLEVTDFSVLTDEQKQTIVQYNTVMPPRPTTPWDAPDAPVLIPDPPKEPK